MAEIKRSVITSKGLALLAECHIGNQISFKSIVIGDGIHNEDLVKMEELCNPLKVLPIRSVTIEDSKVKVKADLNNAGVTEGYFIREIGLVASDAQGEDILYAISSIGEGTADYIPPESSNIVEELFEFVTVVADANELVAMLDSSIIYASQHDLDMTTTKINLLENSIGNYVDDQVSKQVTVENQEISIQMNSNTSKIFFKIPHDINGGAITIKKNESIAKPLLTTNNDVVSELLLDTKYFAVIEEASAFILAPTGAKLAGNASVDDVVRGKSFMNEFGENIGELVIKAEVPKNSSEEIKKYLSYEDSASGTTWIIKNGCRYNFYNDGYKLKRRKYNVIGLLLENEVLNTNIGTTNIGSFDVFRDGVAFYDRTSNRYKRYSFEGVFLGYAIGGSNSAWAKGCNLEGCNIESYYDRSDFKVKNSSGTLIVEVKYLTTTPNYDNKPVSFIDNNLIVYCNVLQSGVVVMNNGAYKHSVFDSNTGVTTSSYVGIHRRMRKLLDLVRQLCVYGIDLV